MQIETWVIWTILAALLIIAEVFTAGFFLLWFGIGAAVAALLAFLNLSGWYQWLAFIFISGVLVFLSRRFARWVTSEQPTGIGADRLIGRKGIVEEEIDKSKDRGKVRVEHELWRAETEQDAIIKKGTKVEVLRIEGTHLIVK